MENTNTTKPHYIIKNYADFLAYQSENVRNFLTLTCPIVSEEFPIFKPDPHVKENKVRVPSRKGDTLKDVTLRGVTGEHGRAGRNPAWLPDTVNAVYECACCGTPANGLLALNNHALNSHPHLQAINVIRTEPSVEVQLEDGQHINVRDYPRRVVQTRLYARMEMDTSQNALTTESTGIDPKVGAAANAAEQPAAVAALGGLEAGVAPPSMISGTVTDPNSAHQLMGVAVPPMLGVITGTQWSYHDSARAAYSIVTDANISATSTVAGSTIAHIPLHTYGPTTEAELQRNRFVSGSTEIQVQLYGTTNTAGALLVYQVDDQRDEVHSLDEALKRPHELISAAAGTTTTAYILNDALEGATPRTVESLKSQDRRRPELRILMYSPLVNTYGTEVVLNMKILTRPGPDFRMWDPVPASRAQFAGGLTTVLLPQVEYLVADKDRGYGHMGKLEYDVRSPIPDAAVKYVKWEIPNTNWGAGAADSDPREGKTGMMWPVVTSDEELSNNGRAEYNIILGGVSSEDQIVVQTEQAERALFSEFGFSEPFGESATFTMSIPNSAGHVGVIGTTAYPYNPVDLFSTEQRSKRSWVRYDSIRHTTVEERDKALRSTEWHNAPRIAILALSTTTNTKVARGNIALLVRHSAPALVVNNLTTGNINVADNDEWSAALNSMWERYGDSSWQLRDDEHEYGRIGLTRQDGAIYVYGNCPAYSSLQLRPGITASDPQRWDPNTILPRMADQFTTLLTDDQDAFSMQKKLANLDISGDRRVTLRRTPKKTFLTARPEAAIIGGIFEGIGAGVAQHAQNKWWDDQFKKQFQRDVAKGGMQAKIDNATMDHQAAIDTEASKQGFHQSLAQQGIQGRQDTKHLREQGKINEHEIKQHARVSAALSAQSNAYAKQAEARAAGRNQHNQALEIQNAAMTAGVSGPTEAPPTYEASTGSRGLGGPPSATSMAGPTPPPVGHPRQRTTPMGANTGGMEQYHPANMAQSGSDLADPMTVSNAVNPYTEGMKRI